MKVSIVLVSPRNPQNIGAAARAMGNFALSDLRVVAPYAPVWREAVSAVGAQDILIKAKVFDTLPQALEDADFIFATTALDNRKTVQKIVPLTTLNTFLEDYKDRHIALVFGPEKTGLKAQDIALADAVLNIPTSAKVPSINLAQAVILCCWELSKNKIPLKKSASAKYPTVKERELVLENLESLLSKLDLPPTLNKKVRQKHLRDINSKEVLTKENIFFINSIISKIIRKIDK